MSARVYDLGAFRHARAFNTPLDEARLRADRAAYRKRTGRPLKCCFLCGKPGHNRQTCTSPTPERVERLNERQERERQRDAEFRAYLEREVAKDRAESVIEVELTPEQVTSVADQIFEALSPRGSS